MADISPELLEQVKREFEELLSKNTEIKRIYNAVADGTADYRDVDAFADAVGEMLADSFGTITKEKLPNGRMYYNIAEKVIPPNLQTNYELIADVARQVQERLNELAGVGIKAVTPVMNQDRIDGIVQKIADYEDFDEAKWMLREPIINFSENVADSFVKANAEFQSAAGLKPKIKRILAGGCCEWCEQLAGEYDYPDVPDDFYRRHDYCRCLVIYEPSKGVFQGVHSKKTYQSQNEAEISERIKKAELDKKAEAKREAERLRKLKNNRGK